MDVAHLKAFVAVSRERNVSRAATALGLTPSPVSRTIRDLEIELGFALFERQYRDMVPTPDGVRLLPAAVDILTRIEQFNCEADAPLRAGCTPWTVLRYHDRMHQALATEPGVKIEEEISATLLHRLAHGDLDVAFVQLPVELPGISSVPIGRYQQSVWSAEPITTKPEIVLADLAPYRVLSLPFVVAAAVAQAFSEAFEKAGITKTGTLTFADVMTLESRMRRTGEVLLCPSAPDMPLLDVLRRTHLRRVPVAIDEIVVEVGVAWRTSDIRNHEKVQRLIEVMRAGHEGIETI